MSASTEEGEGKVSYNITSWTTKRNEGLIIPLGSLYKHPKKDRHPSAPSPSDESGIVTLHWGDLSRITGTLRDGQLSVATICVVGEWSGYIYEDALKPALQDSIGIFEAVTIWEGGDSVYRLTVKDGEVTDEPINL